ncbi:hypothetical protein [Halorussus lipolyticus]|uniref:hypothetical protein n=1 Tax=Halorussus lipolyticus TaxID=3034024 RepID=UPI0023E847C5|nr:hypothetical protein [Halorussus sp. DT80]
MSEPRIPGERIERTRYGERQHEAVGVGNPARYGDPQHDLERTNPDIADRLGYDDDHWDDYQSDSDETDRESDAGRPIAESASASGAVGHLA